MPSPRNLVNPPVVKLFVPVSNEIFANSLRGFEAVFSAVVSPPSSISSLHTVLRN